MHSKSKSAHLFRFSVASNGIWTIIFFIWFKTNIIFGKMQIVTMRVLIEHAFIVWYNTERYTVIWITKNEKIKTFSKFRNLKVIGSKHELARRAFEDHQLNLSQILTIVKVSVQDTSDETVIPSITELTEGWFGDFSDIINPPFTKQSC